MRFSWSKLVTWLIALIVGGAYGLAGTISQSFSPGGVPVGLLLSIVGSGALLLAVRLLVGDRWAALSTGLGMMVATLVFSGRGPGGSVIVPQAADGGVSTGVIWTIAVPVMVALVVAWPDLRRARAARSTSPSSN